MKCPLDIHGITLNTRSGRLEAEITLGNATGHCVGGVEAVARLSSEGGGRAAAFPVSRTGMHMRGRASLVVRLPFCGQPDPERFSLTFTKVEFEDGTPDWRPEASDSWI